jgi:hypothetical protein
MRLLAVLVVLTGCHTGGGTAVPDAGGNGSDAGSAGPGMFITWQTRPQLPGELGNDINLSNVSFQVKSFQVVADSGTVEHPSYLLTWSALMQPQQEVFAQAPAGMYSRVTIELGGAQVAYTTQIQGTWRDGGGGGGGDTPFLIQYRKARTISIACDEELEATVPKSFAVRLDLRNAVSGIQFDKLSKNGDGVLVLDESSDQMPEFLKKLDEAFEIEDGD